MNAETTRYLFVYGTLRRGSGNAPGRLLLDNARFVGNGTFRGRLYLVADYPGAVASNDAQDRVRGEVFLVDDPAKVLPALDAYEEYDPQSPVTSLYRRCVEEIALDGGGCVDAWVYLFNRPTDALTPILTGDFFRRS